MTKPRTRTRRRPARQPTLWEAEDAYRARFGPGALDIWDHLGSPQLGAVLLEAVARGVPWTDETLSARLGVLPAAEVYPAGAVR